MEIAADSESTLRARSSRRSLHSTAQSSTMVDLSDTSDAGINTGTFQTETDSELSPRQVVFGVRCFCLSVFGWKFRFLQ